MNIALVTIGYNRPESLLRLLDSLEKAEYGDASVSLIISLDKSDIQDRMYELTEKFKWSHGMKQVICRAQKMGLKQHVLACGDLTEKYDAIVMLEDDITVSPFFYEYVIQTITKYENADEIAGISLYKHETHQGVQRPFFPQDIGYDVFFMQYAQSWGQCWTKNMWHKFREWYNENCTYKIEEDELLPYYIRCWGAQSWLKYYMAYIVNTGKYFVYPMTSLSTNASEVGEHNYYSNNDYQVLLSMGSKMYRLPSFEEGVKYDIFFERVEQWDLPALGINGDIMLDLYGYRSNYSNAKYLASTNILPYEVMTSIQLKYRPMELNLYFREAGEGIYIYNLEKETVKKQMTKKSLTVRYDVRAIPWRRLLLLCIDEMKVGIRNRFRRLCFGNK